MRSAASGRTPPRRNLLDQAGVRAGVLMFIASMVLTQLSIVRLCEVEDTLVRATGRPPPAL